MESSEQYNFSIFQPRNLHGKKNRNVILSMLLIWAVAVFGFQFLLRAIEKPVPEKALVSFEKLWPSARAGQLTTDEAGIFLNTLINARGKGTLHPGEQKILSDAISCFTLLSLPENLRPGITAELSELQALRDAMPSQTAQAFLDTKKKITDISSRIVDEVFPYTGIRQGSLEASILSFSLKNDFPGSLNDPAFEGLDDLMKLYMTHNQSVLTDTNFLGFPFHYFYTAVFLLILFIALCIVYNLLIEWRLKKEGITE